MLPPLPPRAMGEKSSPPPRESLPCQGMEEACTVRVSRELRSHAWLGSRRIVAECG